MRVSRMVKAERTAVYHAFLDPETLVSWLPPDTTRGQVHVFEACEGGKFRISLSYQDPEHSPHGKPSDDTDTFQGRFVELVPYTKIVEVIEFESEDPGFGGEMRITVSLDDADGGIKITMLYEDIPRGIRPEDNERGSQSSLEKLATLLEANGQDPRCHPQQGIRGDGVKSGR
ncbi:MAG TPA: SRPBCC domain-containing protein [Terriglobales bacterium]|nr:SRPBCC domain-containing protein [Terriglobales bacterium]